MQAGPEELLKAWHGSCTTTLQSASQSSYYNGVQVGMSMNANEEPHRQHCGFYTLGLFTSLQRALACIQTRGMSAGALSILPVNVNAPLSPCLSTGNLTAHETRQMVCTVPILSPAKVARLPPDVVCWLTLTQIFIADCYSSALLQHTPPKDRHSKAKF